MENHDVNKLTL